MTKHYTGVRLESPACAEVDPTIFFPKKGDSKTSKTAQAICRNCPELLPCREYVLKHTEIKHGVWGGLNMKEILRLRAIINRNNRARKAA